jgi:sulfate transport system ATP-binding protein
VLVTHDQEEALEVADRVVVMNQARIEQVGTPDEVFHRPATPFVMEFLGQVNIFHGRVSNGRVLLGDMALDHPQYMAQQEGSATVYMRPHELDIKRSRNGAPSLAARVVRLNPAGSVAKVHLKSAHDVDVQIDLSLERFHELNLADGDEVFIYPKNARVFVPDYVI